MIWQRSEREENLMGKKEVKRQHKRFLAIMLAALLWTEGTAGSVYAAPETVSENSVVPDFAEEDQEPVEEVTVPEEAKEPTEGGEAASEETEQPAEKSVSENTPEEEDELLPEQIPGAEEELGEPPLLSEDGNTDEILSNNARVMSTSGEGIAVQTPGPADIIARYKAYPWSLNVANTYSDKPSAKNPYKAGHLSGDSLDNALNLLNFIRYVAGIPADVTLKEDYIELTQAGALVNCVNNTLTHTPAQPSGFPDELYEKGKEGCGSSNIAYNYGNIARSLLDGWMYDGDSGNISRMGHRRWVLNPSMTQTGFGAVGAYSAMYAFDRNGSSVKDYVAWPARNMPIELMNGSGTPWTLSLGSDYRTADFQKVSVTLKDITGNKRWVFSGSNANGYFQVNTVGYGMPNCIIFRPNSVSYNKTSQFQVEVEGIQLQDGTETSISYQVDFFSLADTPKDVERVTLNTEKLHLLLDDQEGKNKETLHAALTPSNAADKSLKWESLNPAVAAVDENGAVTAVGVGETTVTATAINGKQAACTVKVSDYTLTADGDGINYDEEANLYSLDFELTESGSQAAKKLKIKDGAAPATDVIQWSSENQNVAAVDADGVVTPVGVGEARVWADIDDGLLILSCDVKVDNAEVPTLQMRAGGYTMKPGDTRRLQVYLSPADTKWERKEQKYIKWKSDKESAVVFNVTQADGEKGSAVETISGNTVTVTALAAGKATITAEIVDEAGQPPGESNGEKGRASCEVTVQQTAVLPEEADLPRLIALTNTQNTLKDVALPQGWEWEYPDTSLTQFAGQRTKSFPAKYQSTEAEQPAETLLQVYFLSVDGISAQVKHADEADNLQDVSVLKSGWTSCCYVNYSFEEALEQFESERQELKNNEWYQKQRKELFETLDGSVTLTSSRPQTVAVETAKNAAGKTALTAKEPGSAVLKAQLKLGRKTYTASRKLTVAENVDAAMTVSRIDGFQKIGGTDSHRYAGELSAFQTGTSTGANSKIALKMEGVTRIEVKSSNSQVVAVKSPTVKPSGTDSFEVSLMVKAAGTAEITLSGDDPAKSSYMLTLMVADACPGVSEETVTINTWRTEGTEFYLDAAKTAAGGYYKITNVTLEDADKGAAHSGKFTLTRQSAQDDSRISCSISTPSDTKPGSYKVKLSVTAGSGIFDLPLTVKVVSAKPKCGAKQKNKLNLFYKDTSSLLLMDTEEVIEDVSLTGCNYLAERSEDGYYLKPGSGATLNSVKRGTLKIKLKGWRELTVPFTVGVEKRALKLSPVTGTVALYPKSGITQARIDIKNSDTLPWNHWKIEGFSVKAKGNYEPTMLQEEQAILLKGKNLNQAENARMTIQLRGDNWTESVSLVCNVRVNLRDPAITLQNRTLQLNADAAYRGYDAASTAVKWRDGGLLTPDQGVRVSVYCDARDAKAKALVQNSQVVFSVKNAQVSVRMNNKAVDPGSYKYTVQAAKNGKIWKTPLTLKVVNNDSDEAVKLAAKGSIDVLNRDGSFMTLTPSLKAVNGEFVIPENGEVKLTGRDAHLFRARWSEDGKTIELRAREKETLVINYQYAVTPILRLQNVRGVEEEFAAPAVKFKVKQGSARVTASPKTALIYSNVYNAVEIDMNAALRGADAPGIEKVTLVGNTDAFTYEYNKDGKGTLTVKDTGRAAKGKNYSLQFQVFFAEQADNVKPVTVRYTVKVK